MAVLNYLFWFLYTVVVLYEVQSKSITTDNLKKDLVKKRCRVKDELSILNQVRVRRSAVVDGHWNRTTLTYMIVDGPYPSSRHTRPVSLSKGRVEELVTKAFAEWAPHCGIDFEPFNSNYGRADIMISFENRAHGDEAPFDGPGNTLAHADYPWESGVDIHFDNDETWIEEDAEEDDNVTTFYPIALHEIGHALGLPHTDDEDTIMYGYENSHVMHLSKSDINSLRTLYGIPEDFSTTGEYVMSRTESSTPEAQNSTLITNFTMPEEFNTTAGNNTIPEESYSNFTLNPTTPEEPISNWISTPYFTTREEFNNTITGDYSIPEDLYSAVLVNSTTPEEPISNWFSTPYSTTREEFNTTITGNNTIREESYSNFTLNSTTPEEPISNWINPAHFAIQELNNTITGDNAIPEDLDSAVLVNFTTPKEPISNWINTANFTKPEEVINNTTEDNSIPEINNSPVFVYSNNSELIRNWLKAYYSTQELNNTTIEDSTIPDVKDIPFFVNFIDPEIIRNYLNTYYSIPEELNNTTTGGNTIPENLYSAVSVNSTTPEPINNWINTANFTTPLNNTTTEDNTNSTSPEEPIRNWINTANFTTPEELMNNAMGKPIDTNSTAAELPIKEVFSFYYYKETKHYTYNHSETIYHHS